MGNTGLAKARTNCYNWLWVGGATLTDNWLHQEVGFSGLELRCPSKSGTPAGTPER